MHTHPICYKEDSQALIDTIKDVKPGFPPCVDFRTSSLFVQVFLLHQRGCPDDLVGNSNHHDGHRSVDEVEDDEVDAINDTSTRISTEELIPKEEESIGLRVGMH